MTPNIKTLCSLSLFALLLILLAMPLTTFAAESIKWDAVIESDAAPKGMSARIHLPVKIQWQGSRYKSENYWDGNVGSDLREYCNITVSRFGSEDPLAKDGGRRTVSRGEARPITRVVVQKGKEEGHFDTRVYISFLGKEGQLSMIACLSKEFRKWTWRDISSAFNHPNTGSHLILEHRNE